MGSNLKWSRSLNKIPFPNIWIEFYGKESKNSDKLVKYWIQDLPEDRIEDAIGHMTKFYICDEPISEACGMLVIISFIFNESEKANFLSGGLNNEEYVKDYQNAWREIFKQKMCLICLREGSDAIIGMNIIFVLTKGDTFFEQILHVSKSEDFVNLFKIVKIYNEQVSIFEKYSVDYYMASLGLSVDPKYRGIGLGQKMLEAR